MGCLQARRSAPGGAAGGQLSGVACKWRAGHPAEAREPRHWRFSTARPAKPASHALLDVAGHRTGIEGRSRCRQGILACPRECGVYRRLAGGERKRMLVHTGTAVVSDKDADPPSAACLHKHLLQAKCNCNSHLVFQQVARCPLSLGKHPGSAVAQPMPAEPPAGQTLAVR